MFKDELAKQVKVRSTLLLSFSHSNDMDWSLVLYRLYKRYICIEDIDRIKQIMDYCKANLTLKDEEESDKP